jgi:hypothetical protein
MKNNTNNNNIVELSNRYFYCPTSKNIYPKIMDGMYDTNQPLDIRSELATDWITTLSDDDKDMIVEVSGYDVRFWLWFYDNCIEVSKGMYASQDAIYKNAMTLDKAREYFIREFYPEYTLRNEIETSGEWIEVRGLYINTKDGRLADNGSLHYGDCFDTNITDKNGVDYLEEMTLEEVDMLAKYFPCTIADFKMKQIREYAESIIPHTEDRIVIGLAKSIMRFAK